MSLNPNASISNVFFDVCVYAIFISAVHLLSAFRLIQRTIQKFNWSRRKLTCEWNAWPRTLDTLKNAWSSVYLQTARLLFCCRWGCCQKFCHNLLWKVDFFLGNGFSFLGISFIFLRISKVATEQQIFSQNLIVFFQELHCCDSTFTQNLSSTFKSLENR